MSERTIGIIGAGVMGSGITQTLAQAGYTAICCDISEEVLEKARETVTKGRFGLERAVERGKLDAKRAAETLTRMKFTTSLEQAAHTDLVIECVPERLDLKIRVFRDLDELAPPETVLASNTSGFSITGLAAATDRPDQVIGWHWASPPPIIRMAEIVVTPATNESAIALVTECAERCGKNPVVVKDVPTEWGFVSNRIYFAMIQEAQRVVDSGIASPEDVNQIMIDCFNWPVGPFSMIKGATSGWD